MAASIEELVTTGSLTKLEELGAEIPLSLIELVRLPGVGSAREEGCTSAAMLGKGEYSYSITFDKLDSMKHHDQVFLGFQLKKELFLAEHYKDLLDDLLDPGATLPPGVSGHEERSPDELQTGFEAISRNRLVGESTSSAADFA